MSSWWNRSSESEGESSRIFGGGVIETIENGRTICLNK